MVYIPGFVWTRQTADKRTLKCVLPLPLMCVPHASILVARPARMPISFHTQGACHVTPPPKHLLPPVTCSQGTPVT